MTLFRIERTSSNNRLQKTAYYTSAIAFPLQIPTLPVAPTAPPRRQDIYFVLVQDSLEGPLCPFALIAVTS
jgi:hypothetical protein